MFCQCSATTRNRSVPIRSHDVVVVGIVEGQEPYALVTKTLRHSLMMILGFYGQSLSVVHQSGLM